MVNGTRTTASQRRLSTKPEVRVQIPLGKDRPAAEAVLTAAKLDALTTPLYQRARFPIEEACFQVCHATRVQHDAHP